MGYDWKDVDDADSMKISTPALRFRQGDRVMYLSAASAADLINITASPHDWDPLSEQHHGNRPIDKAHAAGITDYLENEDQPIIGAFVLYCHPDDVTFEALPGAPDPESVELGMLAMKPSAFYDVGDGLHRRFSEDAILRKYEDDPDHDVGRRVAAMGQPFILIPEADGGKRAQDYADLQVNVKPPSGSLGLSMNRRQRFNQFMVEDVVQRSGIALFDGGKRIEFHSDSPGKHSAKWVSFKALRYISGTLLIGASERGAARWNSAVDEAIVGDRRDEALADIVSFFEGIERFEPIAEVVHGELTIANLRETTLLASGVVMYSLAFACYLGRTHSGLRAGDTLDTIWSIADFRRPDRRPTETEPLNPAERGGFFSGWMIDPETARIGVGRDVWERTGRKLYRAVVGDQEYLQRLGA